MAIGRRFSGSDSVSLRQSIHYKCIEYAKNLETRSLESLKSSFENEMWIPLPVTKSFGIDSIKEFTPTVASSDSARTENSENSQNYDNTADSGRTTPSGSGDSGDFEAFLDARNVFREMSRQSTGSERTDVPLSEDESIRSRRSPASVNSPTLRKRAPLVTSASLNFVRSIGKLIGVMESLEPVSREVWQTIRDLFDFYMFAVFSLFGVGMERFFRPVPP
eukprot:14614_1